MFTLYTAASIRQIHTVRLFHNAIRDRVPNARILDWTTLPTPPANLNPIQRKEWFDTEACGEAFSFCRDACGQSDLVVYLGPADQDVGVEIGLAFAAGIPILGVHGPQEKPGFMFQLAVGKWTSDIMQAVQHIEVLARCLRDMPQCSRQCDLSDLCPVYEG